MKMDGVHIFIILMLALICSSCLGSFMREGYENSNQEQDQTMNPDPYPKDNSKIKNQHFSNYDDMYRNLDQETVEYSDSKLAKGKKIRPHRSNDNGDNNDNNDNNINSYGNVNNDNNINSYGNVNNDNNDNDDNNINSYGNVNKYPNVENDNILMAGKSGGKMSNSRPSSSSSHVSKSQIPPGDEDLYILKSQVVPPVCPACPPVMACPSSKEKCPPCPPCARCPEPAFECKKVPNYSGQNDSYLPQPVMSDFSQFGL